uniref:cytochrome c oxidase subunit 3 n=1 Tax=Erythrolobus coxiae TaxID=362235 RepID=UPI001FCDD681|nr:cytochrome c oxidase subunit 3 [Erythrolobus coxiae]UNJ19018.1 cytochrome c oxidase subunit 3 [Erythrolobus coxiae]
MLIFRKQIQRHSFHLVDFSPWPFCLGIVMFIIISGTTQYFHGYQKGELTLFVGLFLFFNIIIQWFRDINREATYEGHHTGLVQKGLRYGILLFIVSELLFFSGFFWGFFHTALSPSIEIGSIWPPKGIVVFNPWKIPFLNTLLLLLSGFFVTWTHFSLLKSVSNEVFFSLIITLFLAVIFMILQVIEYWEASFCFSDGAYGSIFYIMTGFHFIHVFVGFIFLMYCFLKFYTYNFTKQHHFALEAASWYWHMVDVVWLFLYVLIYYWAGF